MDNPLQQMGWNDVLAVLPANLSALAKTTGSVKRWRVVNSGEHLLWLCLVYSGLDMALRGTASYAAQHMDVILADTSVQYRLECAGAFLAAVLTHLLDRSQEVLSGRGVARSLRLQDATSLSVPGAKGVYWRLHTVYVPGHGMSSVELTDHKGAESLVRGRYEIEDLVIADQGLAHAVGLHHVRQVGANVFVRAYMQNLRMDLDDQGDRLSICDVLDRSDRGDVETKVFVPLKGHAPLQLRLVALQIPPEKAEKARQGLIKRASKKQKKVSAQALRLAGYLVLLTSLSAEEIPASELAALYRLRWQIELFFKRCKSLLGLDKLQADKPQLVRTYALGKMILILLLDRFAARVRDKYRALMPEHHTDDSDQQTARPSLSQWRLVNYLGKEFIVTLRGAFHKAGQNLLAAINVLREGKRRRRDSSAAISAFTNRLNPGMARLATA